MPCKTKKNKALTLFYKTVFKSIFNLAATSVDILFMAEKCEGTKEKHLSFFFFLGSSESKIIVMNCCSSRKILLY